MTKTLQNIDLDRLRRRPKGKVIYIRITDEVSRWMAKNKISPSKLFSEAAEVLMEKHETSANSAKK